MTLSKTKCLGNTVRARPPYGIKPKSFFLSFQKLLTQGLSQAELFCFKYPDWIFLPFICSNTLWRLARPQYSKHPMPKDIIFTYHVNTCHLVWLLLVHARILLLLYSGSSKVAFWIRFWAWEHLLSKAKWNCYAWSRQYCISLSLHLDAAFSVLGVQYLFILLKSSI